MKTWFQSQFNFKDKTLWLILGGFFLLRLFWASSFPMANDEVYYWEWSRSLQLSYVDAPPFVAWLGYLGGLFFHGALGARFFVCVVHVVSVLFLIKTCLLISHIKEIPFKNKSLFYLLCLTELSPVFNLEGFLLLPDAGLLCGLAGASYYCVTYFEEWIPRTRQRARRGMTSASQLSSHGMTSASQLSSHGMTESPMSSRGEAFSKSAGCSLPFGFFVGVSLLSKYQTVPLIFGLFCAALFLRRKKTFSQDFSFWILSALTAFIVSSPVFIWNAQNHFASFLFQSHHGFSGMNLNFKTAFRYLFGSIFYLLPWFFIPLFLFACKNILPKKDNSFQLNLFFTLPFFLLFLLILFSALGKQALPHWAMPGFFMLLPAFVVQWHPEQSNKKTMWKTFFIVSLFISTALPTLFSIPAFNKFVLNQFISLTGDASPLAQALQWETLEQDLKNQEGIVFPLKPFANSFALNSCHTPILGSLNWYWTSQMAFHFTNQPRIYNFDLNNPSFYQWRDSFSALHNCPINIIGSADHFDENKLKEIMTLKQIRFFYLKPYYKVKIVSITGVMK